MRILGRAVLILAAVAALAGPRIYEERKQVAQTVNAIFLKQPPLTQGTFKPEPKEDAPQDQAVKPVKPCGARLVTARSV